MRRILTAARAVVPIGDSGSELHLEVAEGPAVHPPIEQRKFAVFKAMGNCCKMPKMVNKASAWYVDRANTSSMVDHTGTSTPSSVRVGTPVISTVVA